MQSHKGHYECETDCIYYQTSKICAHIVVVALKNGDLDKFIARHSKQGYRVNTTELAQSGLPMSSVGKKKAPRKGVSKQKSAKIKKLCAESDDFSCQLFSVLLLPHQCKISFQCQSMSILLHRL